MKFAPITIGSMRLGKWGAQLTTAELQKFVEGCFELGLTDFDHADIYGDYTTERDFGEMLKGKSSLRDKLVLITKCGIKMVSSNRPEHKVPSYDSSAGHIRLSVEQSLRALNTDHLDLLLLHRPDYLMNPEEIAIIFEELREAGKVKRFGVSNYSTTQFQLLNSYTPLVTNQVEVSLIQLQAFDDGTLDQSLRLKIKPMAWSPLGGGKFFTQNPSDRVERIKKTAWPMCEKYSCGFDQLLLAWLHKHPSGMIPVLGTSNLSRVKKALGSLDIQISAEDWYALFQASLGEAIP